MRTLITIVIQFFMLAAVLNVYAQNHESPLRSGHDMPDQFAAMIMKVTKNNSQYQVKAVESKIFQGLIKEPSFEPAAAKENDLALILSDQDNTALDTIFVRDPLTEQLEYSEDGKTLNYTTVHKEENDIMIRFNLYRGMSHLNVYKIEADALWTFIETIRVNLE